MRFLINTVAPGVFDQTFCIIFISCAQKHIIGFYFHLLNEMATSAPIFFVWVGHKYFGAAIKKLEDTAPMASTSRQSTPNYLWLTMQCIRESQIHDGGQTLITRLDALQKDMEQRYGLDATQQFQFYVEIMKSIPSPQEMIDAAKKSGGGPCCADPCTQAK